MYRVRLVEIVEFAYARLREKINGGRIRVEFGREFGGRREFWGHHTQLFREYEVSQTVCVGMKLPCHRRLSIIKDRRDAERTVFGRRLAMLVQLTVNDTEFPAFMNIIEHLRSDMVESINIIDPTEASSVVSSADTVRERVQAAEASVKYTDHENFWKEVCVH